MLIVGRIINGLSVGIESAQVPVYISELAPPSLRGRFVGLQQWAITWGIMIMYYISYGSSYIGGDKPWNYSASAWRLPWGLQMIPALFLHIGMLMLPESPRWLARHDRWEECHDVLARVHAKGDRNAPFVALEMQDIRDMCEFERRYKNITYLDLFTKKMFNRTQIGLFTQIWSQLCGMNVMMYYIGWVFSMAGYHGNANLLASSIQYVINVVMTIPALLFIDWYGRRTALLVGFFLMMVFMYANAGIMASHGVVVPGGIDGVAEASMSLTGAPAKGLIACTYLFVASFAPTVGPASWIYPPELYPLRLRGKGVALSTSGNWAFNMALGLFTPPSFTNIRWKTYIIFAVFNTVAFIHIFFMFPETAGKTLEETEQMFEDPNGIKYLGTPAWKTRVQTYRTRAMERGQIDVESKAVTTRHEHTAPAAEAAPAAENTAVVVEEKNTASA
ncbi:hypothetical protein MAP00_004178 [Monascus purpureus]|nr:hypothetical protein MAP00_004178 [Monascus purpureus]